MNVTEIIITALVSSTFSILVIYLTTPYLAQKSWEEKVREKSEKVAEYIAIAAFLKDNSDPELYRRANQLSFELALTLPTEEYKLVTQGIADKNNKNAEKLYSALINIRKSFLSKNAGNLSIDDIALHSPNIGKDK